MTELQSKNLRALIVDDNRNFRAIMRSIFHAFGVRTIIDAADAFKAFEYIKSNDFDMAFVDLHMPGLDGYEFAQIVRMSEDSPNRRLPLVMVSSDCRYATVKRAITSGFEAVLAKPVRPVDVQRMVVYLLENPLEYIETSDYFGPCRRRGIDASYNGPMRRASDVLADATLNVDGETFLDLGVLAAK